MPPPRSPAASPGLRFVNAHSRARRITAGVRLLRTRRWPLTVGAGVVLLIACALLLTPWLAPHDPAAQNLGRRLAGSSAEHWLGTDHLGRDVLSRLLYGGRFSVTIAAITLILSAVIGTVIGAASARAGGVVDEVTMRTVDVLLSFPDVVVALLLIALIGPGYVTLVLALTVTGWSPFARMARGLTLEISSKDYIKAAEILGCSRAFIVFRHVVPNAIRPLAAMSFVRFGHKLITVGGLSFLGLGVQPPNSDWAAMLADAMPYAAREPVLVVAPGLAIFVTALGVTLVGQGLEMPSRRRRDPSRPSASPVVVRVMDKDELL